MQLDHFLICLVQLEIHNVLVLRICKEMCRCRGSDGFFFFEWLASTCPAIQTQPFSMVFCRIMHAGPFISFDNMIMPYFSQNTKNRKITGYHQQHLPFHPNLFLFLHILVVKPCLQP